ncbi:DJ-1 family protein [candidate division GN15 bacterium]|nr:DJ-1 family protein [candidate division GN15 bacterium]
MTKRALILFADGVEEVEAVAPADVLNRCGVEVIIASLHPGPVKAAYGNEIGTHTTLRQVGEELYDALVIPGGAKNAESLAADELVVKVVRRHVHEGRLVASLCASPGTVLAEAAQVLAGVRATGDPGFNNKLAAGGAVVSDEDVVVGDQFVTARGPGAALRFGLAVAEKLVGSEMPNELRAKWRL